MEKTKGTPYKGSIKKRLALLQHLYKLHHAKETFSRVELLKEFKVSHRFMVILLQLGHVVKIEHNNYYSAIVDNPTESFTKSLWNKENMMYRKYIEKDNIPKPLIYDAVKEEYESVMKDTAGNVGDTPNEKTTTNKKPLKFHLEVNLDDGTVTLPINVFLTLAGYE